MYYRLVYRSLWTTYTVGKNLSMDECCRLCAERYGVENVVFQPDSDGILKASIADDGDIVVLHVYEMETAHAS